MKAKKNPVKISKSTTKAAPKKTADFPFEIPILYEDEHCLAINKPAGVVVHPDGKAPGPFLTDWILANYPQTKDVGEPIVIEESESDMQEGVALDQKPVGNQNKKTIERPGIVHRIDRDTSGVLLIAKTAACHAWLKKQFQDRTIVKKYLAFVYGTLGKKYGVIDLPIGRSRGDFRRWNAERNSRGEMRPATTQYVVLGEFEGEQEEGFKRKFSLIEAEPKTGRTHQIRVHFKAVQHPVVGDTLYAESLVKDQPKALGFKRMALHAYSINFTPLVGDVANGSSNSTDRIMIAAPIPADFTSAMKIFGLDPKVVLHPNKLKMLPKTQ